MPTFYSFWIGNKQDPLHNVGAPSQQVILSIREVGSNSSEEIRQGGNLRIFSYQDLKSATRNFRPDSLLGEGGFGSVYKGWIDEHGTTAAKAGTGLTVAVKQLNQEGLQGHREWLVSVLFLFLFLLFWFLITGENQLQLMVRIFNDDFFVTYTTITFFCFLDSAIFDSFVVKPHLLAGELDRFRVILCVDAHPIFFIRLLLKR